VKWKVHFLFSKPTGKWKSERVLTSKNLSPWLRKSITKALESRLVSSLGFSWFMITFLTVTRRLLEASCAGHLGPSGGSKQSVGILRPGVKPKGAGKSRERSVLKGFPAPLGNAVEVSAMSAERAGKVIIVVVEKEATDLEGNRK